MSKNYLEEYTNNAETISGLYFELITLTDEDRKTLTDYYAEFKRTLPLRSPLKHEINYMDESLAGILEYLKVMGGGFSDVAPMIIAEALRFATRNAHRRYSSAAEQRAYVYSFGPEIINYVQEKIKKASEPISFSYRKKPVVISAYQLSEKDLEPNATVNWPDWLQEAYKLTPDLENAFSLSTDSVDLETGILAHVVTSSGRIAGKRADWVIRGVKGELYFCDNEIFKATYDKV